MKVQDPYKILKIEFDGISEAIDNYTSDSLICNYLKKMKIALQEDSTSEVMYYLEKLCAWYDENISAIYSNQFVYNKREHSQSKHLLDSLFSQLKEYDFNKIEQMKRESTTVTDIVYKNKQTKIFISHSSKDRSYVELLVTLFDSMGLSSSQIFCSSLPGYDIPIDTDIFDYLRDQFLQYDLHVIFIHSENYYQSSVSLNEMGAAWALKNNYTSLLLPGFSFDKMTGVVNSETVAIKLDNDTIEVKDKLNQLYEKLMIEFSLEKKPQVIWERNRDNFINNVFAESKKQLMFSKAVVMKRPF